jgi:hypothetical protein
LSADAAAEVVSRYAEKVGEHEWLRGYSCAVATLLRLHGDTLAAMDLLKCGGDCIEHADAEDLETFRKHKFAAPAPLRASDAKRNPQ